MLGFVYLTGETSIATANICKFNLCIVLASVSFSCEVVRVESGPVHIIRIYRAENNGSAESS